jgi:hypothetical protein
MATMTPEQQGPDERSPWARPAVLISGAFLLLLILAGIIVAVAGGGSKSHHTSTARPPATSATSPTGSNATACTLPPGDQTTPSASPPPGTTWSQVGSMQTPQAPSTLGPQRTNGIWNTCFAHSPSGALLAAFNLWAETTAASPSDVFRRLGVGAPSNLGNNDRLDAQGPVQFAGYKYGSYAPLTAQIFVVIKGPQGKLVAAETTMRWNGEDWKYVFPPGGQLSLQVIPDLTGYVPWSVF